MLSTSNLLWYIYQRNCAVGHPTVISMSQFLSEFKGATKSDINKELHNVIDVMHFAARRYCFIYDLTEDGLAEVEHLKNFMLPICSHTVCWVTAAQLIVRIFKIQLKG